MDRDELEKALKEFENRSKIIKKSNTRSNFSNRFFSFLSDAYYLKDLEIETDSPMKSFLFQRKNFQYTDLSKDELFVYIAARTSFRNGKLPNVSRLEFLLYIYIYEIVNGIHGSSYECKKALMDSLFKLFPCDVRKYDKVFIEGYEILFLQFYYLLDAKEYFESIPIKLFENCTLSYKQKLPVRFMTADEIFNKVKDYVYKGKIKKNYTLNDKCIFDECFDYVKENVDYKINKNNYSLIPISKQIEYELSFVSDSPYKNMMVTYPQKIDVQLIDSKNKMHYFHYGFHSNIEFKLTELNLESIYEITDIIIRTLNQITNWSNKSVHFVSEKPMDLPYLIKESVIDWVCNHPYAQEYNEISTFELESKIQEYKDNPEFIKKYGNKAVDESLSGNITLDSYEKGISKIETYIERAHSKSQLDGRYKKFEDFYSRTINPNDRSIDLFITEANKLKDIDCSAIRKTSVCHFTKDLIQYYLLRSDNLFSYFGFRTQIRKQIIPTLNNFSEFLMLYLTEIVNGVHGDSYELKRSLMDDLMYLHNKKKAYKNLIAEAYEIIYMQYSTQLDFNLYKDDIPLLLFDRYRFTDKDYVNVYSHSMEHVFKEIDPLLRDYISRDRLVLKGCFDFVIEELKNQKFKIYSADLTSLFEFKTLKCDNYQLKKIKAKYPESFVANFVDDDEAFHTIKNGIHTKYHYYFEYSQKKKIVLLLQFILYFLYRHCGGIEELTSSNYNFWTSFEISRLSRKQQNMIDSAVVKWVNKDKKILQNVLASPFDIGIKFWIKVDAGRKAKAAALKSNERNRELDISDVDAVRKDSHEIQDRLIIEDEEEVLAEEEIKPVVKTRKKKAEVENDGTLLFVTKSLSSFDKSILKLLIDFKVDEARECAQIEGTSLELIIDRINELSMQSIEDVLIIDNEVIYDYLEDLRIAMRWKKT